MTFREVEKILKKDGWILDSVGSSHYQYEHPTKKGKVTIPRHGSKDIDIKTLKSIFKQAGIEYFK